MLLNEMSLSQRRAASHEAGWGDWRSFLGCDVVCLVSVRAEHQGLLALASMASHDPCSPSDDGLFAALDLCVVMACRHKSVCCGLLGGVECRLVCKCKQERTKRVALPHPSRTPQHLHGAVSAAGHQR